MREHWDSEHPEKYAKVRAWLREQDAKVMQAEMVAEEGMRGPCTGYVVKVPKLRRQEAQ